MGGWHVIYSFAIFFIILLIKPKDVSQSLSKKQVSYLFTNHLLQRLLSHLTTNTPRRKRIPLTEHIFDFFQRASRCFGEHEENVECGADVEDPKDKVGYEPLKKR